MMIGEISLAGVGALDVDPSVAEVFDPVSIDHVELIEEQHVHRGVAGILKMTSPKAYMVSIMQKYHSSSMRRQIYLTVIRWVDVRFPGLAVSHPAKPIPIGKARIFQGQPFKGDIVNAVDLAFAFQGENARQSWDYNRTGVDIGISGPV